MIKNVCVYVIALIYYPYSGALGHSAYSGAYSQIQFLRSVYAVLVLHVHSRAEFCLAVV